jgi:hypothetical protein
VGRLARGGIISASIWPNTRADFISPHPQPTTKVSTAPPKLNPRSPNPPCARRSAPGRLSTASPPRACSARPPAPGGATGPARTTCPHSFDSHALPRRSAATTCSWAAVLASGRQLRALPFRSCRGRCPHQAAARGDFRLQLVVIFVYAQPSA